MNLSNQYLKAWLSFNTSPTEDALLNQWTTYGNPTIGTANAFNGKALQLDGASYLKLSGIELGGKNFYIDGWVYVDSSSPNYARVLQIVNPSTGRAMVSVRKSSTDATKLDFWANSTADVSIDNGYTYTSSINSVGSLVHFKLIYRYSDKRLSFCINDKIAADWTNATQYTRRAFDIYIGALSNGNQGLIGAIDELRIYDGVWFSYNYGNTPTLADYQEIIFTADVERKLSNAVEVNFDVKRILQETFRYYNAGTADLLSISGTTLNNLPESKSKTGTAFYQTTQAKCFDIPATPEIWIKFEVYWDGTNFWRAFNGTSGINPTTPNGYLRYRANNVVVADATIFPCKKNQLQTVLLHMVSGSSAGVIEAWVDGDFIYRYTGDVNHGQDFADIYLQSDGAGTFFSNVMIANKAIGFDDGYHSINFDVQRNLSGLTEFTFDVERNLVEPIIVPAIGEHFNHIIYGGIDVYRGGARKIILPKRSKAYIHAIDYFYPVRVFSDTDPVGKTAGTSYIELGDMYAELDECTTVFIEIAPLFTAQQVVKAFMGNLIDFSSQADGLDLAINACTGGKIPDLATLKSNFLRDLNSSANYTDFLSNYCDIILDNLDTGAMSGKDAGGGLEKTAQSVVREKTPIEQWEMPEAGTSIIINNLKVQWPTSGVNGNFSNSEKFILKGLNSEWIARSLELIYETYEISFHSYYIAVKEINVNFENSDNDVLAYVSYKQDSSGNCTELSLSINMRYYEVINPSSEDGSASTTGAFYLDRTLAHELTHGIMAALLNSLMNYLPLYIKEGAAELVHGIDDTRRNTIVQLLTTRTADLEDVFSTGSSSSNSSDHYAAGYMLLRYLAKQGRHSIDSRFGYVNSTQIGSLLISDGATLCDGMIYEALTDNTRQIISADISRQVVSSLEYDYDIEIFNVIIIELLADIKRALTAEVNLFGRNRDDFFADVNNPFVYPDSGAGSSGSISYSPPQSIAPPANTIGLQNFEVVIAEQQITDQVNFTAVTPFDIMQQVKGKYIDYNYDMRVERVQQQGILYSCECCSDVDQLLYTQIAYKIPATTSWFKIDGEEIGGTPKIVEVQTVYPRASTHVTNIAKTLGLTPVMQFDDFLSTVLMDDQGGVTYNDLIRDIFGWSSRIPTKLINIFIREGKLFVIERGHESHTIDISKAKMTVPIITKELVRTTWGSTPWSKTNTQEWESQSYVPPDVTISSGSDTGSGSGSGIDDDEEEIREVTSKFFGSDYEGYTTYSYNREGLLVHTYTYTAKTVDGSFAAQRTNTNVSYEYDVDGTMIKTTTDTQSYGPEGDSSSKSIDIKHYIILPNGEKFLSQEFTARYQNDSGISVSQGDLVDSCVTIHQPSRVGQIHNMTISSDGEVISESGGQNTGDDRVTPFRNKKAVELTNSFSSSNYNDESGEWQTHEHEYGTTIHGLSLYDSSFPIHNKDKLIQVTNELRNLNRKTKETVNTTIYDFEHLIDFDDKIKLNGATYFLVHNTARTTPRIKFEQNLTLARWY